MKNDLDECIRMKNALKLENKQKELEEDRLFESVVYSQDSFSCY